VKTEARSDPQLSVLKTEGKATNLECRGSIDTRQIKGTNSLLESPERTAVLLISGLWTNKTHVGLVNYRAIG
jgi:hypothetical protein